MADLATPAHASVPLRLAARAALGLTIGAVGVVMLLRIVAPHPWAGVHLPAGSDAPSLEPLRDPRGGSLSLDHGVTLLYFGYTDCVDLCPLTLSTVASAFRDLEADPDRLRFAMISVDAAADPMDELQSYVTAFDPAFVALGGSQPDIDRVASLYGIAYGHVGIHDTAPGIYHTSVLIAVVDGDQRVIWGPEVTAAALRRDLSELLG